MSRRRLRRCRCGYKRFSSSGAARSALELIRRNSTEETVPQRVYPCPSGKGWHLTHQELRTLPETHLA